MNSLVKWFALSLARSVINAGGDVTSHQSQHTASVLNLFLYTVFQKKKVGPITFMITM